MLATVRVYDVVLWIHITAVVTAFGTLFAYPLLLSVNAKAPLAHRAQLHRLQIAFSQRITGPTIGIVLAAGAYLASEGHLWGKAWVVVPLALLLVIAGLGVTGLRRNEERLISACEGGDGSAYAAALSRLQGWTTLTLALVVVAIFFMAAKPFG